MSKLDIWTDGASNPHAKPTPGGWAYAYVHENILICTKCDGEIPTTNQRMEQMGAIRGLEDLLVRIELDGIQYDTVDVITDSAYVCRGMSEMWYVDWRFNNWTKKEKDGTYSPIANTDLWQRLIQAELNVKQRGIKVMWSKVKGHSGVMYNEVVDKLAVLGKKKVS